MGAYRTQGSKLSALSPRFLSLCPHCVQSLKKLTKPPAFRWPKPIIPPQILHSGLKCPPFHARIAHKGPQDVARRVPWAQRTCFRDSGISTPPQSGKSQILNRVAGVILSRQGPGLQGFSALPDRVGLTEGLCAALRCGGTLSYCWAVWRSLLTCFPSGQKPHAVGR